MKKIVLFFVVMANIGFAQKNFSKLEKEFKEIKLPYETTKDYYPKIGHDEVYDVEIDFKAENGLVSEITSNFKENGMYYNSNSRYFSVGKFKFNNFTFIIYYIVTKHNSDGHLESYYNMDMYDVNGTWKNSFVIGENRYKLNYMKDPVTAYEDISQTNIKIEKGNLVINKLMIQNNYLRTPDEMKLTKSTTTNEIVTIDSKGKVDMVRK
ncbi:hypothetical protein [Flavobacterium okayamense]|uniref:Uncharacterized protein n=1 Tax=Flavobacterium okayamense TaxID=2830782 RepID=A0ABN6HZL1_9FLAO|nr:hypothetical protein [Flavobacterium okayamense]BCY28827.1 hypothetical protein KK2020170_16950 [Flavobacterium okayamense]